MWNSDSEINRLICDVLVKPVWTFALRSNQGFHGWVADVSGALWEFGWTGACDRNVYYQMMNGRPDNLSKITKAVTLNSRYSFTHWLTYKATNHSSCIPFRGGFWKRWTFVCIWVYCHIRFKGYYMSDMNHHQTFDQIQLIKTL